MNTRPLTGALILAIASALPAQDDREQTSPVSTTWVHGQSVSSLSSVAASGWRITDVEIESLSPLTLSAALVRNTGAYSKTWWWYVGVTGSQLGSYLSSNNARLIDFEPYDDGGTTRFVAVMIRNTGADTKAWWWYYDRTTSQIASALTANNGRLVDLEHYAKGRTTYYACIMVRNAGGDNRAWWYYYNLSLSSVQFFLATNNARPYSIERVGSDRYDVIMLRNAGAAWWHYYGVSDAALDQLQEQHTARIIDVERYAGSNWVVLIDNANALEQRVRYEFDVRTDGVSGGYLRQVGGAASAEILADFRFEPASLLKTLYHAHAMRRVSLGQSSLAQAVTVPIGLDYGSCPNGSSTTSRTLETVLRRMMEQSNNEDTFAIELLYGRAVINASAAFLGMSSTAINHTIGCGATVPSPNTLTLRDLYALHDAVVNGYVGAQRDKFYELMNNGLSFPTWGTVDLDDRIATEATSRGLPSWARDAFEDAIVLAFKPGGYTVGGKHFHSLGGFIRVPFKDAQGHLAPREYVFGVFNHDAANLGNSRVAVSYAALELVWEPLRAALATWDNHTGGSFSSFGTGCTGTAGTPLHAGSGTPEIGETVSYRLTNAPAGAPCLFALGFSNTTWGGLALPVPLDAVGAPGCAIFVDLVVTVPANANGSGAVEATLALRPDPAWVGRSLFTQFLVADLPANAFGITTTNGLRTTLGGYP